MEWMFDAKSVGMTGAIVCLVVAVAPGCFDNLQPCESNAGCPGGQECVRADARINSEVPHCRQPVCGDCRSDEYCDRALEECMKAPCPNSECRD